eukprot:TRINITY_DN5348_c3_g1_i1.p1 TRINITY_DN5348_c3_g1~~TRINITY_DN5348_c3_g1_i1.p1  ORF type:complete len:177 (-),score=19.02 TRINITY_DN5348_c3_g1_i1:109-639(-)
MPVTFPTLFFFFFFLTLTDFPAFGGLLVGGGGGGVWGVCFVLCFFCVCLFFQQKKYFFFIIFFLQFPIFQKPKKPNTIFKPYFLVAIMNQTPRQKCISMQTNIFQNSNIQIRTAKLSICISNTGNFKPKLKMGELLFLPAQLFRRLHTSPPILCMLSDIFPHLFFNSNHQGHLFVS